MAVTTIFSFFFYGTRSTQYKVTPTSQYKVTSSISPNSQLVLAPFLDGRRFVSLLSLPIGGFCHMGELSDRRVTGRKLSNRREITLSILHTDP